MDDRTVAEVLDCANAAREEGARMRQLISVLCQDVDPAVAHVACALRELAKEQDMQLNAAVDQLWFHATPCDEDDEKETYSFDDEPTVVIDRPIATGSTSDVVGVGE